MATYRIYLLDQSNRIRTAEAVEFETDEQALSFAKHHPEHCAKEVWCGATKVGSVPQPLAV